LLDSRERWRDLVIQAADFAFETDEWGRFVFVVPDPALGWSASTLVGQPAELLLADGPEHASFNPFRASVAVRRRRAWLKRGDGGVAVLAFAAAPLLDAHGRMVGARGLGLDMTEYDGQQSQVASALRRGEVLDHILWRMGQEVLAPRMMRGALDALVNALGAEGAAVVLVPADPDAAKLAHQAGGGAAAVLDTAVGMLHRGLTTGAHASGAHATGAHPAGAHPIGAHPTGAQATGAQATGAQSTGAQATGAQSTGAQATATQATGAQATVVHAPATQATAVHAPAVQVTAAQASNSDGRRVLVAACQPRFGGPAGLAVWRIAGARPWDNEDRLLLAAAANLIRFALEHEAIQREMARQARTDPLTGLLNRRAFMEEIERCAERLDREQLPGTLMFVDLDNFKVVNDEGGHEMGDQVLVQLAILLRAVVRPTDLVARLGGDEFALWMNGADHMTAAERAEQLRIQVPREMGELTGSSALRLGVSIGIATRSPGRQEPIDHLLRRADMAMYQVKNGGRGHWRVAPRDAV